jgi:hypothetical protein
MIKKLLFVLGILTASLSLSPMAKADWAWNGYHRVWYCGPHCRWEHARVQAWHERERAWHERPWHHW